MTLNVCIDLEDISFWIFEEQGAVAVVVIARRLEDLNALLKQLVVTRLHIGRRHAEGKLNARAGRGGPIIGTPTRAHALRARRRCD